ncbi:hypothetical protein BpHYR1_052914 [Brachionus plicatilis]|uniref:Uncharacterized protein n=1 Tax=Brachionus plicatilis TaxID=10195 RepID=A0A3M7RK27_BRAPC|nr:hypothetical protein BpHYR1_052914 [Brachionus plicatilis]
MITESQLLEGGAPFFQYIENAKFYKKSFNLIEMKTKDFFGTESSKLNILRQSYRLSFNLFLKDLRLNV